MQMQHELLSCCGVECTSINYNEPGQFSSSLLSGQSDEPSHLRAKLMQLKSEHMNSVLSHPDSATEELYNRQHSPTQIFF